MKTSKLLRDKLGMSQANMAQYLQITLPAGNSREDAVKKKVRLEYKKFLLENRKESYGVVALLEKELDLKTVTASLVEIDVFIGAINTRKAAL